MADSLLLDWLICQPSLLPNPLFKLPFTAPLKRPLRPPSKTPFQPSFKPPPTAPVILIAKGKSNLS